MRCFKALSVVVLMLMAIPASFSHAQSSFFDDFEDGNAVDGAPRTWNATSELGEIVVEDGSLVLSSDSGQCCSSAFTEFSHTDVEIDTEFTFPSADNIFISAWLRDAADGISDSGYWAGAFATGELAVGWADRGNSTIARRGTFLPSGSVDAGTDVTFHVEMIGDTMTFSAWETALGPLESATITWTDRSNRYPTGGFVSAFINPNGNTSEQVLVRSYAAKAVPEPDPGLLAQIAFSLLFILGRQKRR